MHIVIAVLGVAAAIIFFMMRAHSTYRVAKEIDRDTKMLQHRAKNVATRLIGTRLSRVRDPQLAAAILMIQLVRSSAHVTAQEKIAILDNLTGPMGIANPQALFERAWDYTENRGFFSMVADELLPMLRSSLSHAEKQQLVDMLYKTANAYGDVGELQNESIVRFKKRLLIA